MFYKSSLKSCDQKNCSDINRAHEYFINLPRIPILLTLDAMDIEFSLRSNVVVCYRSEDEGCGKSLSIESFSAAGETARSCDYKSGPSAGGVIFQSHAESGNYLLFRTTMSDLDADLYGGEFNFFLILVNT